MPLTSITESFVSCLSSERREVARLRITAVNDSPLWQLDPQEAQRDGEASTQLRENGRYWCELIEATPPNATLWCRLFGPRAPGSRPAWLIETGAHVGLLRIDVLDTDARPIGTGYAEVRSVKLDYRDHYRAMLNDLSERMLALVYDARSSSVTRLRLEWHNEPRYLQQQIEFLRETLAASEFRDAVQRILAHPHQRLRAETNVQPIGKPTRHGRDFIRQIAIGQPRIALPHTHPLAQRMSASDIAQPSVPMQVTRIRKIDDLDTPENQFVKAALEAFRDFLARAAQTLRKNGQAWDRVAQRAEHSERELAHTLSHTFFQEISPLRIVPLGSPVLQRKAGYRDVLQAWLRFQANARIVWDAADDIFRAGKRDTARLYEYWLFFQLLDWFCARFDGAHEGVQHLVEVNSDGLLLTLQHGQTAGPFEGVFADGGRKLKAQFSYNRAFAESSDAAVSGSWTRAMRPDFTITVWPAEQSLDEAEANDAVVHLHLDAKYRVEQLQDVFDEDGHSEQADVNRDDLIKMHAYRDAIRRTAGAYVLYPGHAPAQVMFRGDGLLPSLGAFAIIPTTRSRGGRAEGMDQLAVFLDAVIHRLALGH